MMIIGLTGGIGSGKTTVGKYFEALGIPIYIADVEAKKLMNRSKIIKRKLLNLFGDEAYIDDTLNRDYLASKIFSDKTLLQKMNAIVHPKVASHFKRWLKKQNAPYVLKEAAIIFENNLEYQYDYIITVVADKHIRVKRVMERDNVSNNKVNSIMKHQLSDEEKISRSDFVITNDTLESSKKQVLNIHNTILSKV